MSESAYALRSTIDQNVSLLIDRIAPPISRLFDKLATQVISQNSGTSQTEEEILVLIGTAFSRPFSKEQILGIYERSLHPSAAALIKTLSRAETHYIRGDRFTAIPLDNVLYDTLLAYRRLGLCSKEVDDSDEEAGLDILGLRDNPDGLSREVALHNLMCEFIELSLWQVRDQFIARTGLFYCQNPSIYESDRFIVEMKTIVQDSLRHSIRLLQASTVQATTSFPYRHTDRSERKVAAVVPPTIDTKAICDGLSQLTQEVQELRGEYKTTHRILQKTQDNASKHSSNVEEDIHQLVVLAETKQHHLQQQINRQQQQQQPQPQQAQMMYVTPPQAQQEGERDENLFQYPAHVQIRS